jgi:hypothetical protein
MPHSENIKIARVVEHKGQQVLSFNKVATTYIPPDILFGASYKLMRHGIECKGLSSWNPRKHGIKPEDLELHDVVHLTVVQPDDFFLNLLAQQERHPGMTVWVLDVDLQTSYELVRGEAALAI